MLKHTPTAATVATRIREIVERPAAQLRYPLGPNTGALLEWRTGKSDEEWIALGATTDSELGIVAKRHLDIDV